MPDVEFETGSGFSPSVFPVHDPNTTQLTLREKGDGRCFCGALTWYVCAKCGKALCVACASKGRLACKGCYPARKRVT